MKKICIDLFRFKICLVGKKLICLVIMMLLGIICFSRSGFTPLFMFFSRATSFAADVYVPDRPRPGDISASDESAKTYKDKASKLNY